MNVNVIFATIGLAFFAFSLYLFAGNFGDLDPEFFLGVGLILCFVGLSIMFGSCLGCQGAANQNQRLGKSKLAALLEKIAQWSYSLQCFTQIRFGRVERSFSYTSCYCLDRWPLSCTCYPWVSEQRESTSSHIRKLKKVNADFRVIFIHCVHLSSDPQLDSHSFCTGKDPDYVLLEDVIQLKFNNIYYAARTTCTGKIATMRGDGVTLLLLTLLSFSARFFSAQWRCIISSGTGWTITAPQRWVSWTAKPVLNTQVRTIWICFVIVYVYIKALLLNAIRALVIYDMISSH